MASTIRIFPRVMYKPKAKHVATIDAFKNELDKSTSERKAGSGTARKLKAKYGFALKSNFRSCGGSKRSNGVMEGRGRSKWKRRNLWTSGCRLASLDVEQYKDPLQPYRSEKSDLDLGPHKMKRSYVADESLINSTILKRKTRGKLETSPDPKSCKKACTTFFARHS